MAKIVGVPFHKWVENQISHRQKVLGKTYRSPEELQYLSNKGSWVRVASSVDVTDPGVAEELGIGNLSGKTLAEGFVLFGGVVNTYGGLTLPQGGVVPNQESRDTLLQASRYSYGFGSKEYGYLPPPGVDSLKIRHLNRGSIRKYSLKLKAQNLDQFKIIDALYLRLGYYLLIEWGHTSYFYTPDGETEPVFQGSPEFNTPAFQALFYGTKDDVIDGLQNHRYATSGNYDGGLVKVDNFNWSFNEDGSYDITISAVSIGGLIDSLTMNYPGPNLVNLDSKRYVLKNLTPQQQKQKAEDLGKNIPSNSTNIDSDFDKIIATFLSRGQFQLLIDKGVIEPAETSVGGRDINRLVFDEFAGTIFSNQYKSVLNDKLLASVLALKEADWLKWDGKKRYKKLNDGELIAVKFENGDKKNTSKENYYMRLDALIQYINDVVIKLNFSSPDATDSELEETIPTIGIEREGAMFTHWFQGSADPYTCLIPFQMTAPEGEDELSNPQIFSEILGTDFRTENEFQGNIGKIHVNMECIAEVLQAVENSDPEKNIRLFGFLDELMSRIQVALGSINKFTVLYDEDANTIFIQDDTKIPNAPRTNDDATPIRAYGVDTNNLEGSFVKNISMVSELTPNTAKEMAVGAVSTGDNVTNSTSLLGRWNIGFNDRLDSKDRKGSTQRNEGDDLLTNLNNLYTQYFNFVKDTYVDFSSPTSPDISVATANLPLLLEYDLGIKTINGEISGKGFIPINLTVTLDGLSGVLLYQKFRLTPNILPPSYTEALEFVVKAIDHTITNNEWTTSYGTLSVPKFRAIDTSTNPSTSVEGEFSILKPLNS